MSLQPARPTKHSGSPRSGRAVRPLYAAASAAAGLVLVLVLVAAGRAPAASPAGPVVSWSSASPASRPPALAYSAAAFDTRTSQLFLFGGVTSDNTLSSATWIWNGSTWSQAPAPPLQNGHPLPQPAARELASMAYDPATDQLILFGGRGAGGALLDDTWAWNGSWWNQLDTSGTSPSGREAAAMAFDGSGDLLLFGGTGLGEGAAPTTTTSLPAPSSAPSPAGAPTALGDTWQWTGNTWVQAKVSGPPARSGAVLAYDQAHGTTVLFGGEASPASAASAELLGDTWAWSGGKWTQESPSSSPSPRFGAAGGDFPPAGGPLILGGEGSSGALSDAWVWTGVRWVKATVEGTVPPQVGAAGAYDSSSQTMVFFGGEGAGGATLEDTGLLEAVQPEAPPTTVAHPTTTPGTSPPSTKASPHPATTATTRPTTATTGPQAAPRPPATVPSATSGPETTQPLSLQAALQKVPRGGTVDLSGAGFAPGSVVTLTFHSTPVLLGTVKVGPAGTFSKAVAVPEHAAPGQHHIEAAGTASTGAPAHLTAIVTVVLPPRKSTSTVTTLALVGLAILIPVASYLGMAAAGVRRRRRQASG